jgi:hypothetical protein
VAVALCNGRITCAGTIAYAEYRWNNDITIAAAVTNTPSQPRSLFVRPSSSSMNSSAFFSASASTAALSGNFAISLIRPPPRRAC